MCLNRPGHRVGVRFLTYPQLNSQLKVLTPGPPLTPNLSDFQGTVSFLLTVACFWVGPCCLTCFISKLAREVSRQGKCSNDNSGLGVEGDECFARQLVPLQCGHVTNVTILILALWRVTGSLDIDTHLGRPTQPCEQTEQCAADRSQPLDGVKL